MARDVFISYRHEDQALADRACAALERQNISCWIAPRDISPGRPWATSIVEGIQRCHTFVLVLSSNCRESKQIARELELADAASLRIVALRVEDVQPSADLLYFLANVQWIDGLAGHFDDAVARLAGTVSQLDAYPAVKTTRHVRPLAPPAVPLMAELPAVRTSAVQPFSVRAHRRLLGVLAIGLMTVGLGAGAYRGVKHSKARDAYTEGQKYAAMHNPRAAVDEFNAALKIDPGYYDAYCGRAEVYQSLGKRGEAQRDLRHAVAIHPKWAFALDLQRQFAESRNE